MMCSIHLCLQTGRKDILPGLEAKVPGQKEPQERLSSDSYLSQWSHLWDPSPRVPALPRGSDSTPLSSWSSAQPNPFHFLSFHFALFYSFIVLHGRHTNGLFKRLLGVAICVFSFSFFLLLFLRMPQRIILYTVHFMLIRMPLWSIFASQLRVARKQV